MATLVNSFLVGCDPELVLLKPPNLVQGTGMLIPDFLMPVYGNPKANSWGFDHNGWVVEPHPKPSRSVLDVTKNLKRCFRMMHLTYGKYRWRAGAYLECPERAVTLGGHVHIDVKRFNADQVVALATVTNNLLSLDFLPQVENQHRVENTTYGRLHDCRFEHGHSEYRAQPSWLFSPGISALAMTAAKLAVVDPKNVETLRSRKTFRSWLEKYKGQDDDVDYLLEKDVCSEKADPDVEVKDAWGLEEETKKAIQELVADELRVIPAAKPMPTVAEAAALGALGQQAAGTFNLQNALRAQMAGRIQEQANAINAMGGITTRARRTRLTDPWGDPVDDGIF